MESSRLATLAAASVITLICASSLKADEIEVQFTATFSTGPFRGESLSSGFSYSTTDPLETSIDGVNTYALSSPEDNAFLSFGGLKFAIPLSGATAIVAQAPVSFDTNPNQDYFAIQDFSDLGFSIQLVGDLNFLSSGALPDPFNAGDVMLGPGAGLTSVIGAVIDGKTIDTDITEISSAAEPRGPGWVLGAVALLIPFFRRSFIVSRS